MREIPEIEFLTLDDVLELHREMINTIGGSHGVNDMRGVESAVAQPQMTFDGEDIYPTLREKAAALAFSLVKNHAFTDGNKRVGHAAMVLFLDLNGHHMTGTVDEHEQIILALAASEIGRDKFTEWVRAHVTPLGNVSGRACNA